MSTFSLGRWRVRRSGYGAMQLDGPFAAARPPDRAAAVGVLRAAVAAGVDHITPAQVALQWLLQLAPNVLLIPGTASLAHLRDNLAAENVTLDDEARAALDHVRSP
jgi:aryl-alcohol dehydrogenase-like predicted oxidoreductase